MKQQTKFFTNVKKKNNTNQQLNAIFVSIKIAFNIFLA